MHLSEDKLSSMLVDQLVLSLLDSVHQRRSTLAISNIDICPLTSGEKLAQHLYLTSSRKISSNTDMPDAAALCKGSTPSELAILESALAEHSSSARFCKFSVIAQ